MERLKTCWCIPGLGCMIYNCTHIETFVPAGQVGFLMNEKNEYLFMQPGMHNIFTCFMRQHLKATVLLKLANSSKYGCEDGE